MDLVEVATPRLQRLAAATGETVNLAVLTGDRVLYLVRLRNSDLVTANIQVGSTLPAVHTSIGKLLLACVFCHGTPFRAVCNRGSEHTRKPRSLAISGEIGGSEIGAGISFARTIGQGSIPPTSGDAWIRVGALGNGGIPASSSASPIARAGSSPHSSSRTRW